MVVLTCLIAASGAREPKVRSKAHKAVYNHILATILMDWTCPRCDGKTKRLGVIKLIACVQHCLQAYVGVAMDLSAVNWVKDLYWKQLDINDPSVPGAMVHHGFYYAYHDMTIRPGILDVVIRAKDLYGDINVMATGNSMGKAMASFCGLDLVVNHEALNVQVLTFGQPHICNTVFVWLYNIGFDSLVYQVEKDCDTSGEDPSYSKMPVLSYRKYLRMTYQVCFYILVTNNSLADHLVYYGVKLMAEPWGSCKIEYGSEDKGNLMLSRITSASALRLR
ncbi:hypothetical protein ACJRO7_032354 [Eucalyptus globulus]|uniref:Fungal lipase-type domain-containing protein n=1 Tax=Eucalyptus globulus TaxID=34317 RepID=A0ABD3JTF4_EUCGL